MCPYLFDHSWRTKNEKNRRLVTAQTPNEERKKPADSSQPKRRTKNAKNPADCLVTAQMKNAKTPKTLHSLNEERKKNADSSQSKRRTKKKLQTRRHSPNEERKKVVLPKKHPDGEGEVNVFVHVWKKTSQINSCEQKNTCW